MTDDQLPTERWVYLGEYAGQTVKRVVGYRKPNGDITSFKKTSNHTGNAVGYIYEITPTETGMTGTPRYTGDKADDFDELRMQARAREFDLERVALEAKARTQDPDLEALLEHVKTYAARYKKTASKDALIRLIERAVWRS